MNIPGPQDPSCSGHAARGVILGEQVGTRARPGAPRRRRRLRHDPFHLRIAGADPLELASASVAAAEADRLLGVIAARVATGQTGAEWQRRTLAALEPRLGREGALAVMLQRYLEYAATDQPVHTWPPGR